MNNKILKIFLKVLGLAIVIILFYQVGKLIYSEFNKTNQTNIINEENNNKNTNAGNFKDIKSSEIAKTGVAITTNIGIKHYKKNENLENDSGVSSIYNDIFTVEELKNNRVGVKEILINKNMLETKEYFYLLRTDFKSLIKNSKNRKNTLETIYSQLRIRYNNAIDSIKTLESQKAILLTELDNINNQTEIIKQRIGENFKNSDNIAVNEGIERYIELKNDYIYIRTYTVFVNNFLKYYIALNDQNLKLINALTINRDAIEKGSYVVLPSSGNDILKEYGLLYTEEEFRVLQAKKESE